MASLKTMLLTVLVVAICGLAGRSNASGYNGAGYPSDVYSSSPGLYSNPGMSIPQEPGSYSNLLPIPDLNPPPISVNQQPGFGFNGGTGHGFAPAPPAFPALNFPAVGEP